MSTFVFPGDQIQVKSGPSAVLGPNVGVSPSDPSLSTLNPTTAGILNIQKPDSSTPIYYVEANSKRYIPQVNDFVLGTVIGSFGEYYRVSLNDFSAPVLLHQYSFPNATKKNRPRLQSGDTVYARVSAVQRNVDPEIACVDATTGKDGGFGVLSGGFVFPVRLAFARFLLFHADAPILSQLVSRCKFELAIGVNGRIWIKTDDIRTTVACANAIKGSQEWSSDELAARVEDTFKQMKVQ